MRNLIRTAVILALAAGPSTGATAAPKDFSEVVEVVEVEVPVEVRDREGRPVRGLTASDFRLFDEGKPREIARFEEVVLDGSPAAPAPSASLPAANPHPRHILLLFDLSFSNPLAVTRAREKARDVVVDALHPSDLVAVATYSIELGARLLVTFTPDRAQVARAIDSLSFDRTTEVRALDPLRFMVPFASESGAGALQSRQGGGSEAKQEFDQQIDHTQQVLGEAMERDGRRYDASRVSSWMRGLGEFARYLAAVEGRKQIVLFSEGFDSRLLVGRSDLSAQDVQDETVLLDFGQIWRVDTDVRYGNANVLADANRLIELFKRSDCVVHAIDIGGLRAAAEGRQAGKSLGQDALFYYANESGGQLFRDANDLGGQMRDLLARTDSSYVLGFRADKVPFDGSWRRLRVELVGRKGLKVSHRSGWYSPRPFPELHPFERDLLTASDIATGLPKNEIGLSLLAAPFRAGPEVAYVPVILEIDGPSLLRGMKAPARVDLYAYATSREGAFRAFFHRELRIDPARSSSALTRGGVKYYGHFELRPDDYVLRVLVRDGQSGRVGVALQPLKVPDFSTSPATLLPPFFFDAPGRWTMLRERADAEDGGAIVYPFVAGGDPYVPQAGPTFRAGERPRFCVVAYNLGSGELGLEAVRLTTEGERPIDVGARAGLTSASDYHQWLAEIDLSGLQVGEHRIRWSVVERSSGRRIATTESSLRVEG